MQLKVLDTGRRSAVNIDNLLTVVNEPSEVNSSWRTRFVFVGGHTYNVNADNKEAADSFFDRFIASIKSQA